MWLGTIQTIVAAVYASNIFPSTQFVRLNWACNDTCIRETKILGNVKSFRLNITYKFKTELIYEK